MKVRLFGIWELGADGAAQLTYDGLYSLQHEVRGAASW